MSRMGVSRILAEELGRVLGEYRKVDGQWESLATERRRLAGVAQRLSDILRHEAGQKASERLVSEMGLSEMLAALPHLPGRSRSVPAAAEAKAPAPEAPPMAKGSGIRMLAGLYKGWTGTIRWANTKAGKTTYTVSLQGPEGQSARTQVAPRSLGQKWEAAPEITAAPPRTRGPRKAAAAARPAGRTAARLVAPPPPADALPKGTAVRLLTGKFEGWAGVISAISAKGRAITYAVTLRGPDGQRGRTQVNQGSLGRSWQVTDGAAPGLTSLAFIGEGLTASTLRSSPLISIFTSRSRSALPSPRVRAPASTLAGVSSPLMSWVRARWACTLRAVDTSILTGGLTGLAVVTTFGFAPVSALISLPSLRLTVTGGLTGLPSLLTTGGFFTGGASAGPASADPPPRLIATIPTTLKILPSFMPTLPRCPRTLRTLSRRGRSAAPPDGASRRRVPRDCSLERSPERPNAPRARALPAHRAVAAGSSAARTVTRKSVGSSPIARATRCR